MAESAQPVAHGVGSQPLLTGRPRALGVTTLVLSLLAYAAINLFWQYLGSGQWRGSLIFSFLDYRQGIVTPLGDLFHRPLSVFSYPWMIVVIGLILGAVVLAPIVVSVLFRLPHVAAFLLVTALVGNAPILALTLAVGCFLTAITPLRSNLPIVAAIIGMVPPAAYMVLASFAGGDSATILPVQRWIPYAPTCIAAVSAIVAASVVLAMIRLLRFKAIVLVPVLAIMSGLPVWLFYQKIGPAELDYALIVNRLPSSCTIFDPARVEVWSRENKVEGLSQLKLRDTVQESYQQRGREIVALCDRFLDRYAGNPRTPDVLYLKGQCLCLQLDQRAFDCGNILLTDNFTAASSRDNWQRMIQDCSSSPQSALANWRLGELLLREGKVAEARQMLRSAQAVLVAVLSIEPRNGSADSPPRLFPPLPSLPDRPHYELALQDVRELLWLIDANAADSDAASAEALSAFQACDPCRSDYSRLLVNLLRDPSHAREQTRLGNNIKLAIAMVTDDFAAMSAIASDSSDPDAAVQANFELGRLAMQKPTLVAESRLLKAQVYLQKVIDASPNPFAARAKALMGSGE